VYITVRVSKKHYRQIQEFAERRGLFQCEATREMLRYGLLKRAETTLPCYVSVKLTRKQMASLEKLAERLGVERATAARMLLVGYLESSPFERFIAHFKLLGRKIGRMLR